MIRATALLFLMAGPALGAVTNAQICQKVENDARLGGGMTVAQCTCFLEQGDRRMDRDLARLWKEALYTGQSREQEVAALNKSQSTLERQMRRTLRDARRKCGISNPFGF